MNLSYTSSAVAIGFGLTLGLSRLIGEGPLRVGVLDGVLVGVRTGVLTGASAMNCSSILLICLFLLISTNFFLLFIVLFIRKVAVGFSKILKK
jgi:hypothetical protein